MLADRGLTPDMGPAVYAIAEWVMHRNQEFVTADLTHDSRLPDAVGRSRHRVSAQLPRAVASGR